MRNTFLGLLLTIGSAAAPAQEPQDPAGAVVAVPPLTSPDSGTKGNEMLQIGWQATQVILSDLGGSGEFSPLKTSRDDYYSYPEVTAPGFQKWRSAGAKLLVTGFVQGHSDGRLTFGCYVYDVDKGRELARKGLVLTPGEWRRAAHTCSSLAYTSVVGAPGGFDSRIAYVAQGGVGDINGRRIALMDSDGSNHRYVTTAASTVLTPRFSPKANRLAYVSFATGKPAVRVLDLGSGQERPLIAEDAITFAPRYSPDGSRILFSMMRGSNSDIYVAAATGGAPLRLTSSPGIDTDGSFSPDGSRIIFESDRSGSQQLYVMNADGTGQRRITFGSGEYGSPVWSPDGQWIAFTHRGPDGRRIGLIKPDGAGERLLTNGPADEGPSWAPNSHEIVFERAVAGSHSVLLRLALRGQFIRQMTIPQDGSGPDWSGAMD